MTGTYSNQHYVPGLIWYDQQEKRMVNYGSAKGEVWKTGVKKVIKDTLTTVLVINDLFGVG